MKKNRILKNKIGTVPSVIDLDVHDIVDTKSFYTSLDENRKIVTSYLNHRGIKKGSAAYNSIPAYMDYKLIKDLVSNQYYEFSKELKLNKVDQILKNNSHYEVKNIYMGVYYLTLDDILTEHLEKNIRGNSVIQETDCLSAAQLLSEMTKLGLALGFLKLSDEIARKKLSKSGKQGGLQKKYDIDLQQFIDLLYKEAIKNNSSPKLKDVLVPLSNYDFGNPLEISDYPGAEELAWRFDDVFISGEYLCWKNKKGEDARLKINNLYPYLKRTKSNYSA